MFSIGLSNPRRPIRKKTVCKLSGSPRSRCMKYLVFVIQTKLAVVKVTQDISKPWCFWCLIRALKYQHTGKPSMPAIPYSSMLSNFSAYTVMALLSIESLLVLWGSCSRTKGLHSGTMGKSVITELRTLVFPTPWCGQCWHIVAADIIYEVSSYFTAYEFVCFTSSCVSMSSSRLSIFPGKYSKLKNPYLIFLVYAYCFQLGERFV